MELLYLFTGLVIGLVFGWIIKLLISKSESGRLEERNKHLQEDNIEKENELNAEREKTFKLNSNLSSLQADYDNLQEKLAEQKGEIEKLQEKFIKEFENLANKIFEEKSSKFTEQNKTNLKEILDPLKERISEFQNKVEETNKESIDRNAALRQQLSSLKEMNLQMSQDAQNLTNALKGEVKTMGNWGEMILERILEISGLEKDREYIIQESVTTEDGKRLQPDVIVRLPDKKNIIIDSKVSLLAYEKYTSLDDEKEKQIALKEHISSIRSHLKNLSSKGYQNLYQNESLDFVLMFIPIEGAFALALQNDNSLYNYAFGEMNIIIVSPTTLLATLRTIENIWKQEHQSRNVIEIAKQSGALYDKFVGFVDDLIDIGNRMDQAKNSYEGAMNKLKNGRGNLIGRAENIKQLGAKTSKSLPQKIVEGAEDEAGDN
ncbi:MAG: DNA recombination protein RmuC [Bacteroidetes bacterium]|nr:DNA recombination protein RmuC [Bacteroidota bacterium]MCH8034180.1 DNA recombination protein RmuC [Bacteroidota bacterium]